MTFRGQARPRTKPIGFRRFSDRQGSFMRGDRGPGGGREGPSGLSARRGGSRNRVAVLGTVRGAFLYLPAEARTLWQMAMSLEDAIKTLRQGLDNNSYRTDPDLGSAQDLIADLADAGPAGLFEKHSLGCVLKIEPPPEK